MTSRVRALALVAIVTLALTACTPQSAPTGSKAADPASGGKPAAGDCGKATGTGHELFSDEAMSAHPEDGFTFGDGSKASFVYDRFDEKRSPTFGYDLSYIQDDGGVIPMGGSPFFETDGGSFSTANEVFDSNAAGRFGFFEVTITQDVAVEGNKYDGSTIVLGRYCTKFAVSE